MVELVKRKRVLAAVHANGAKQIQKAVDSIQGGKSIDSAVAFCREVFAFGLGTSGLGVDTPEGDAAQERFDRDLARAVELLADRSDSGAIH